ncbi:PIN domain-containing protein [Vibrio sp. WXL103]|uniref:PIN domain-containing protein n=1 Tax=unclassified Vibrio TaxID=2614977 RepID=UPI003EC8663A
MKRYMLDSYICHHVVKHRPVEMLNHFNNNAAHLTISNIVLADLLSSANISAEPDKNRRQIESFSSRLDILDYPSQATWHYGEIRAHTLTHSLPLSINDCHIAAHARAEGLILITSRPEHYQHIPGLYVENWLTK